MANRKISELQSRTPALSDLMLVGDPSSGYSYKCTVTALATIIETDIADGYVTIGTTQTISGAKTFSNNLTLTSVANATTTQTKFLTLNGSNVVNYRTGAEVLSDIGGASASSISGTTNYVAKFTSSSAIGNSAIYSNTSGNVSIGNTNDAYKLDVSGTVRSTSNFVVYNGTVVGNYAIETAQVQIGTFSNHPFVLTTFNTERVRIDTSGNVTFSQIANATIDTDKFLVSDSGVLKYRTGAELLSDIGGASAALYVPYTGATTNVNLGTRTITANGVYSTEGIYVANTYGLYGRNAANNAYNLLVGITGQDKVYIDGSGSGTIMNGTLTLSVINNATVDTDTFLVADSGVIKYRTGTQLLSDIGAASSSSISGTTNYIPKFTSSSAIGNSQIFDNGTSVGIGNTANGTGYALEIARNASTPRIDFVDNAVYTGQLKSNAGIFYLSNTSNNPIVFSTNNTERMRLDASGNLGLGTSSPSQKLDVNGITSLRDYLNSSTDHWQLYTFSDKSFRLNYNGSGADELTLTSAGNLGLGVTPASWYSTGYSALQVRGLSLYSAAGNDGNLVSNAYLSTAPAWTYLTTGTATRYEQGSGSHQWFTAPSGTAGTSITFTERMRLDINGNLGLGVTPSAWSLGKAIDISGGMGLLGYNNGSYYTNNAYYNGAWLYKATSNASYYFQANNGQHQWYIAPSGTAGNAISFTQAMTLDASGRLGIGTTSPARTLTVYNTAAADAALIESTQTFSTLAFKSSTNASTVTFGIDGVGNAAIDNKLSTGAISMFTNASERMRITSGGNVGIGTTSPGRNLTVATSGESYISLTGGASSDVGCLFGTSASDAKGRLIYNNADNMQFWTASTERMRITSAGELLINTTSDAGDYKLQVNGDIFLTNGSTYTQMQFKDGTASGSTWSLISGFPNLGDFTIREAGVQNSFILKKTTGNLELVGSIKTAAPSGGNAAAWKLGERVASSSLTLNTTQYIQLDINGTLYTLATVNLS